NGEITLENVNETLGLISDENLDDIISAIKAKDRAAVGGAITRAFRSGLAANVIAESLITRLRDIEFDMLDKGDRNFSEFDKIIDALRAALGEMYGSGIPDIILEMTLMKLAAPVQSFVAPPMPAQTPSRGNLDAGQKIFYDTLEVLNGENKVLAASVDKAVVTGFADDTLTLGFKNKTMASLFDTNSRTQFEQAVTQFVGRPIKISVVVDENLPPPVLSRLPEPERSNLANAIKTFQASDATKIND
ncbi:MAG: hypothetical protein IKG61_03395, partial [Selenomonadaceae bacterium]|nr:hypothetical protein [Selenomonadaceae bacterium]